MAVSRKYEGEVKMPTENKKGNFKDQLNCVTLS